MIRTDAFIPIPVRESRPIHVVAMLMRPLAPRLASFASRGCKLRRPGVCLAWFMLSGCDKKTQKAEVVSKQHVPAAKAGEALTDERQLNEERWLINVEMDNRLRTHVDVTPEEWRTFKVGDRVRVNLEQGQYTGTIWGRKLEKMR